MPCAARRPPSVVRSIPFFALFTALGCGLAASPAARAATLAADGVTCTLGEAIDSANADADTGGCVGVGPYGDDQIFLDADVSLVATDPGSSSVGGAFAGLPDVTSAMTITARLGDQIERSEFGCNEDGSDELRLFNVLGATADLTLEGLTLARGCVVNPAAAEARGGNLLVIDGALTLDGVWLSNGVVFADEAAAEGAALHATSATVEIRDSTIAGNLAQTEAGGARGAVTVVGAGGTLEISGSSFLSNEVRSLANLTAGAALHVDGPVGTIADTRFTTNQSLALSNCRGGALFVSDTIELLERVSFDLNLCTGEGASSAGGAVYIDAAGGSIGAITDCVFDENRAHSPGGSARGGALYAEGELGALERCTFEDNVAEGGSAGAVGFDAEGGALFLDVAVNRIANVTFGYNRAVGGESLLPSGEGGTARGGAIYGSTATAIAKFTQVTMAANQAIAGQGGDIDGGAFGGGLFFAGSGPTVVAFDNNLLVGNSTLTPTELSDSDCRFGTLTPPLFVSGGYNWVGAPGNCDFGQIADVVGVDPGVESYVDAGCVDPPPLGCGFQFTLAATSLALDWGSCAVAATATDGRGAPRPVDLPGSGNVDDGCDPGAFERQLIEPLALFVDSFESGDTAAWSATVP